MRLYLALLVPLLFLVPTSVFATTDVFFTSYQAPPAWWQQDGQGGFFGQTTHGDTFSQRQVFISGSTVRLHQFTVGDASFYISDRGIILASSDMLALSMYLTRG
jgi:hypothetical protein